MPADQMERRSESAAPAPGAEAAPAHIIRLEDLHKSFGAQVVLDGVSIRFATGKTTVIMGPSGCGKSVLLRHIVGLLRPDSGEVYFQDQRIDQLREDALIEVRRQVGFVFQLSALFDSMTIGENLEFPLVEHTGLGSAERQKKVKEALELVDLAGVEGKRPAQLSGGQQRRVALARAIMLRPRVMLYDEPTTGLDPVRADGISSLILKLQHDLGVTGVCVTHDLVAARKIADRAIMLGGGKIVADGTFEEVEHSPDEHVQNFMQGHYEPELDQANAHGGSSPAGAGRRSVSR